MLITVVTVARNAESTIGDAVGSVARQTYPDIEHILIDGASTDQTVDVARRASTRLTHVVSEPDGGIYDAMNKGLRMARGTVVGFLNADDLYANDNVLASISRLMCDRETCEACYADLVYVDRQDTGKIIRHWRSSQYHAGLFARGWVPPHPTVYFRRHALSRVGLFDTRFRLAADFEHLLRAFEVAKISSVHVPSVWVKMRLGGATNKSVGNVARGNREIAAALRQHGVGWPPLTLALRMLRRLPQFVSTAR